MTEPLKTRLAALLNEHSIEGMSDTPDFLLAEYLINCLDIYEKAIRARDKWFDFEPWHKMAEKD